MSIYKLVVVDPFENYKRGDQIYDQSLVKRILDQSDEMHHYERNVRRVLMNQIEKQMYIAPLPENKFPTQEPQTNDAVYDSTILPASEVNLVSIADTGE